MTPEWLQIKIGSVDFLSIIKGWWFEGKFRSNPSPMGWRTSKFRKKFLDDSNSSGKDFWKEICITLSIQMDSNHSLGYHTWINIELGLDYFIQPRYPTKEGAEGTSILYVFISFRCYVCKLNISFIGLEMEAKPFVYSCNCKILW